MINKIYKQRMEDPPPLENRARGVPAAFAAVIRKLMSKNPEERYQNAAELRADLARWTDPERVHAILGAEAEAARSFRPPPPELAEDDLRLFDSESAASRDSLSLRELGGAEPSLAPRHQSPLPPAQALVRHRESQRHAPAIEPAQRRRRHTLAYSFRDRCRRRRPYCDCLYSNLFPPVSNLARNVL